MRYQKIYNTPNGFSNMIMESDGKSLSKLYFQEKVEIIEERNLPIFELTEKWLDNYFKGEKTNDVPNYKLEGTTPFREKIMKIIKEIPYGETITYGEIAKIVSPNEKKMSSQAVGNAVGWNPICIIIPCHRVIGKNNKLIGYSGGINNKKALLELEKMNTK